jgi:hypothetical protein
LGQDPSRGRNEAGSAGAAGSPSLPSLGFGGSAGFAVAGHELTVEPAELVLDIADREPQTASFAARFDGAPVEAAWTLDNYDLGRIEGSGRFTARGLASGVVVVKARYGNAVASARVRLRVKLTETFGPSPVVSAENERALLGQPSADPGAAEASRLMYPYAGTVMPRGVVSPLFQLSAGTLPPEAVLIALKAGDFEYRGVTSVAQASRPQVTVPADVWDAALRSAAGKRLEVSMAKALGGAAYGPYTSHLKIADASLKGVVYYQTYDQPNHGLWSVRPGSQDPAQLIQPGCVVCHSVSSNGKRLGVGADNSTYAAQSGVYDVASDGSIKQVTGAPQGLGGDSRGLSFPVFTPDGRYVTRSRNDFWGGRDTLAFKIDDANKSLLPADVVGLKDVDALLPAFSHDGKRYVFTNGPDEKDTSSAPLRSLSLMDVTVDDGAAPHGQLTFSNRRVLVDHGADGAVAKFATFLPDSNLVVYQSSFTTHAGFDRMLPTWDASARSGGADGLLRLVSATHQQGVSLANLNPDTPETTHDYEPFALPVPAGGYYWIVFTSTRPYGSVFEGSAARKQLWVAAISPDAAPGSDPSHPPFYLPGQSDTRNERGFWALDPCRAEGDGCESGDQCCGGFCRPEDASDPASRHVCRPPEVGECVDSGDRCAQDSDCCELATGQRCIGGYCSVPPIQ